VEQRNVQSKLLWNGGQWSRKVVGGHWKGCHGRSCCCCVYDVVMDVKIRLVCIDTSFGVYRG
jgi:hypothetical protein